MVQRHEAERSALIKISTLIQCGFFLTWVECNILQEGYSHRNSCPVEFSGFLSHHTGNSHIDLGLLIYSHWQYYLLELQKDLYYTNVSLLCNMVEIFTHHICFSLISSASFINYLNFQTSDVCSLLVQGFFSFRSYMNCCCEASAFSKHTKCSYVKN